MWLWLVGGLVLVLALWAAHVWFWTRRLSVPQIYAETHRVAASDGGMFELRRLPQQNGGSGATEPPVLLVHGIAANHRNLDAHPDRSLARALASSRDVWLLTLRSGVRRPGGTRDFRFETMASVDLPEAIAEVCARTGSDTVDYVGFSMGGMLLYAALTIEAVPAGAIRRVGVIGAPAIVASPLFGIGLVARLPRFLIPRARFRMAARSLAFATIAMPHFVGRVVCNLRNIEPRRAAQALVDIVEDIPRALQADFAAFLRHGEVSIHDRSVLEGLAHATQPALFIAGGDDHLAPAHAVEAAFEVWGSDEKAFHIVGRPDGRHAYGHGDLVIGSRVAEHVFAPMLEFLNAPAET